MIMNDFMFKCKNDLIMYLNMCFSHVDTLNQISAMAEQLETEIESFIKNMVITKSKRFFLNFSNDDHPMMDDDGNQFSFKIIPIFDQRDVLQIVICNEDVDDNDIYKREIKITGNGIRKKIIFIFSAKIRVNGNELFDVVQLLYETGYNWFAIMIEEYVSRESVSVAHIIYKFMRSVFCNDELYKKFWIAIVGRGYGFRLVNLEQVKELFSTFSNGANKYHSINEFVSNLIGTRLPYEKLLMKEALDYNEKIDGDISHARYTKDGNVYSKTMSALYKGNAFSIYPILNDDTGILGLYPVEYKNIIEEHLDARKIEIVEIIKREMGKIDLAYSLFDDNYRENLKCGISYFLNKESEGGFMTMKVNYAEDILEMYYDIYCKFGLGFVADANVEYSMEDLQCRMLLVENNMIQKSKGGYCITEKGIRHYDEKREIGKGTNISGNSGIVIIGNNSNVNSNNILNNFIVNNRQSVDELIIDIRKKVDNSADKEFVDTLLNLLEEELQHEKPKDNIIKKIIKSLETVNSIGSYVLKLKKILGL